MRRRTHRQAQLWTAERELHAPAPVTLHVQVHSPSRAAWGSYILWVGPYWAWVWASPLGLGLLDLGSHRLAFEGLAQVLYGLKDLGPKGFGFSNGLGLKAWPKLKRVLCLGFATGLGSLRLGFTRAWA